MSTNTIEHLWEVRYYGYDGRLWLYTYPFHSMDHVKKYISDNTDKYEGKGEWKIIILGTSQRSSCGVLK